MDKYKIHHLHLLFFRLFSWSARVEIKIYIFLKKRCQQGYCDTLKNYKVYSVVKIMEDKINY